jgi:hypothetical protein
MRTRLTLIALLLSCAALAMGSGRPAEPQYTADFGLEPSNMLVPDGKNRYHPLRPGKFLRLEGEGEGQFVELEITVLKQTRPVVLLAGDAQTNRLFQTSGQWIIAITRVVEEREWIDGQLAEVSLSYLACCPRSGNVFCFGRDVDIYEDGEIVGHEGSWLAGEKGAQPGLVMPGLFLLGSRYYQEYAPGVAMDRAENMAMGLEIETQAGTFQDCVKVLETNALDDGEDVEEVLKYYAPSVGLIADEYLQLVSYN